MQWYTFERTHAHSTHTQFLFGFFDLIVCSFAQPKMYVCFLRLLFTFRDFVFQMRLDCETLISHDNASTIFSLSLSISQNIAFALQLFSRLFGIHLHFFRHQFLSVRHFLFTRSKINSFSLFMQMLKRCAISPNPLFHVVLKKLLIEVFVRSFFLLSHNRLLLNWICVDFWLISFRCVILNSVNSSFSFVLDTIALHWNWLLLLSLVVFGFVCLFFSSSNCSSLATMYILDFYVINCDSHVHYVFMLLQLPAVCFALLCFSFLYFVFNFNAPTLLLMCVFETKNTLSYLLSRLLLLSMSSSSIRYSTLNGRVIGLDLFTCSSCL